MTSHDGRSGRAFYVGLLEALVQVMGTSNGYLFHHGPRAAILAHGIGGRLGLEDEELARIFFGGVLMDLGMIGLVEGAWEDGLPVLSPDVRTALEVHPVRSAETVAGIPYLEDVAPLVEAHHEWWDGSGYPRGLAGDDIAPGARILRLADTVCALAEERPYRPARSAAEIRSEIRRSSGSEFSPEVVRAFFDLVERGEELPFFFDRARFGRLLQGAAEVRFPASISAVSTGRLLRIFGSLIDAKDPYTGGHSRRVAELARAVAGELGLDESGRRAARSAGYLHDLGKVSVPLRILTKSEELGPDEVEALRKHPVMGASILRSIPSLRHLTPACRYHHERWDGRGYPEGIAGDRIPLVAQILAVCDAYDAMTSGRSYGQDHAHDRALEEIDRGSGAHFGPRPAHALLALPRELFRRVRGEDGPGRGADRPGDRAPARSFATPSRPRRRERRASAAG